MTVGCNDATPNATYDHVYVYDAVANLYLVLNDEGGEVSAFLFLFSKQWAGREMGL